MLSTCQAANVYLELGLDAIPLKPNSKMALLAGWQKTAPETQWEQAPADANIGLRCGGESALCVLDSDDKKVSTWQNVHSFLAGIGIDPGSYPVIQTLSGGKHAYLSLAGTLDGNYRNFAPSFGAGEFRYGQGCYVAAPPSTVSGRGYWLVSGDFRQLPRIDAHDLAPIVGDICQHGTYDSNHDLRRLPRLAVQLLNGMGIEHYPSRSEAEQAILTSLVNSGFEFGQALMLFQTKPAAGKFAEMYDENPRRAVRWLECSFRKAQVWAAAHESPQREAAQKAITWAESTAWRGRTGSVDRAVYLAHATIAYQAGRLTYAASSRTLAELSGVQRATATTATNRLCKAGLLRLDKPAVGTLANTYRLCCTDIPLPKDCEEVVQGCNIAAHDAFRALGLGKSAADVFKALQAGPLTVGELEQQTGRHRSTIWRVIRKMARIIDPITGEIIPMVEQIGDQWVNLDVDLDYIAGLLGTAGKLEKEKALHTRERAIHNIAFQRKNNDG